MLVQLSAAGPAHVIAAPAYAPRSAPPHQPAELEPVVPVETMRLLERVQHGSASIPERNISRADRKHLATLMQYGLVDDSGCPVGAATAASTEICFTKERP